jgi:hypothetical protein
MRKNLTRWGTEFGTVTHLRKRGLRQISSSEEIDRLNATDATIVVHVRVAKESLEDFSVRHASNPPGCWSGRKKGAASKLMVAMRLAQSAKEKRPWWEAWNGNAAAKRPVERDDWKRGREEEKRARAAGMEEQATPKTRMRDGEGCATE